LSLRLIEPQFDPQGLNGVRLRINAQHETSWITRNNFNAGKDDQARHEQ
jgi:hypothetical protein